MPEDLLARPKRGSGLARAERARAWTWTLSSREIPARQVGLAAGALAFAALLLRFVPAADRAFWTAAKLVPALVTLGLAPGLLAFLAVRPLKRPTVFEAFGASVALSLAFTQLLTLISLALHVPCQALALAAAALSACALVAFSLRRRAQAVLVLEKRELVIGALAILLGLCLYAKGTLASGEDAVYVSVIERMRALAHPAIHEIHYGKGLIYLYPFHGLHFFAASVSALSGIEPFFVYDKLRLLWGPAAVVYLYLAARRIFGSTRIAFAVALAALAFVFTGAYGRVGEGFWFELVPYSHASDVALSVLWPALLVTWFYALWARTVRAERFFMLSAVCLISMLTFVHTREVLRFLVYAAGLIAALLFIRPDSPALRRTVILALVAAGLMFLYALWYRGTVGYIAAYTSLYKKRLLEVAGSFAWRDFFSNASLLRDSYFLQGFDLFFRHWNPLVLALSPLATLAAPGSSLVLAMGAFIGATLLIAGLPALSIPTIYLTYSEVLFLPVQNVVFFVYLLTGLFLFLTAVALARFRHPALCIGVSVVAASLLGKLWVAGESFFAAHQGALFLLVPCLHLAAWMVVRARRPAEAPRWLLPRHVPRFWGLSFGILLGFASLWGADLSHAPLALHASDVSLTAEAHLRELGCRRFDLRYRPQGYPGDIEIPGEPACPPPAPLVQWARRNLSPHVVLAINALNGYSPSAFFPVHIVAWPVIDHSANLFFRGIFPLYYDLFDQAVFAHGTQPFFNRAESLEQRLSWMKQLGVTHVLVDPMVEAMMRPLLQRWPGVFKVLYDDRGWIVYRVETGGIIAGSPKFAHSP